MDVQTFAISEQTTVIDVSPSLVEVQNTIVGVLPTVDVKTSPVWGAQVDLDGTRFCHV
jgi:hypothetical protein